MNKAIELAEAQFIGFFHAKKGYSLEELISSMGLTKDEWEIIKKEYDLNYIDDSEKEEITNLLT